MERQKEKDQGLEPQGKWNHKEDLSQGFLNIRQVADYLGIKVSTLYSLVEEKKIPHYRIGRQIRFKRSDIDAWMDNQKEEMVDAKVEARKVIGSLQKRSNIDVDRIVKKSIDEVKGKGYISQYGKPDQARGLRKEVKDGTI